MVSYDILPVEPKTGILIGYSIAGLSILYAKVKANIDRSMTRFIKSRKLEKDLQENNL